MEHCKVVQGLYTHMVSTQQSPCDQRSLCTGYMNSPTWRQKS